MIAVIVGLISILVLLLVNIFILWVTDYDREDDE